MTPTLALTLLTVSLNVALAERQQIAHPPILPVECNVRSAGYTYPGTNTNALHECAKTCGTMHWACAPRVHTAAICRGDVETMKELMKNPVMVDLLDRPDWEGHSALYLAVVQYAPSLAP